MKQHPPSGLELFTGPLLRPFCAPRTQPRTARIPHVSPSAGLPAVQGCPGQSLRHAVFRGAVLFVVTTGHSAGSSQVTSKKGTPRLPGCQNNPGPHPELAMRMEIESTLHIRGFHIHGFN